MEGILNNALNVTQTQKSLKSISETENEFAIQIAKEIAEASRELKEIENAFNLVVEDELIESYIYQQNALKAKLNYLIRLAKEKNIRITEYREL